MSAGELLALGCDGFDDCKVDLDCGPGFMRSAICVVVGHGDLKVTSTDFDNGSMRVPAVRSTANGCDNHISLSNFVVVHLKYGSGFMRNGCSAEHLHHPGKRIKRDRRSLACDLSDSSAHPGDVSDCAAAGRDCARNRKARSEFLSKSHSV